MEQLTFGSLFAGIGGIDLGFERAGMRCLWQVEKDAYCQKVLAKHWPNVDRFEDVKNVGREQLKPVNVIVGGFPCQPHSVAGQRRGAADDRNLWPEYLRIVNELKPAYVVGENVPGIITTYLDTVLSDLEGAGYAVATFNLPACGFDAPHKRERIFVIAYAENTRIIGRDWKQRDDDGSGRERVFNKGRSGNDDGFKNVAYAASEQDHAEHNRPGGFSEQPGRSVDAWGEAARPQNWQAGHNGFGGCGSIMANANEIGLSQPEFEPSEEWTTRASKRSRAAIQSRWAIEPGVGRVANGVPIELDLLRGLRDEKDDYQKANTEKRRLEWKILRTMWKHKKLAETSPRLYLARLYDCLPDVSHESSPGGWLVGAWIETNESLCDLWKDFYSKSFKEAQDVQQILLERIGEIERKKKMGPPKDRVDRLKALGNAVVPQVAEFVGRLVVQHSELF